MKTRIHSNYQSCAACASIIENETCAFCRSVAGANARVAGMLEKANRSFPVYGYLVLIIAVFTVWMLFTTFCTGPRPLAVNRPVEQRSK